MSYQGSGLNGADGLGLRLAIPKGLKKTIKKVGRGLKKVVRSPIFKGAVIGAAGGYIYQQIRKRQKKKAAVPSVAPVAVQPITPSLPPPVPYIPPPEIPLPSQPIVGVVPAPAAIPTDYKRAIAEKIMRAIPLSPDEMAIVRSGALGQGMLAAAEAAYGSEMYQAGAGQPLPAVTVTAEPERRDNTLLYVGLGLGALLLLTQQRK